MQVKSFENRKKIAIYALVIILLLANIAQLIYILKTNKRDQTENAAAQAEENSQTQQNQLDKYAANNQQIFFSIQNYLDSISPNYVADVQSLASQYNIPSWGCGPSSYALAKIINSKFFNNQLSISATYNAKESAQIIERFGFYKGSNTSLVDHAWVEVYLGDKFLFIDPTIGQFGQYKKIVYKQFAAADQNIRTELQNTYGIQDVRMSLLVQKAVDRIPADQQPYPGYQISQDALTYYLGAVDDRNDVESDKVPDSWGPWVDYLVAKYT